jgi:hypothetical protein
MANGDAPGITVALEYYKSARAEIVERLKARDTILLAYLGAIAVLFGMPDKAPLSREYLPLLIPLLSFAVSASVAQHQEIVTTLTVYLAGEWKSSIPQMSGLPVPPEMAPSVIDSRARSFRLTLWTQISVVVLPAALSVIVASPFLNPAASPARRPLDWVLLGLGAVLTLCAAARLWRSMVWRRRFIERHLGRHKQETARHAHH